MTFVLAVLVTVAGIVVTEDGMMLPGVTVTLLNATPERIAVTNADGRYSFAGLREGAYDIRYELLGFETGEQRISAWEERTEVPPQELVLAPIETITISCDMRPCSTQRPTTGYEMPLCDDYDLHSTWMNAAQSGDRSAIDLLHVRWAETKSLRERHRLAGALLRRVADDRALWKELFAAADICVRFPRQDSEHTVAYYEWADARAIPPDEHWWMAYEALGIISSDPRSHALLLKALASSDQDVVALAVAGLGEQHDERSLPLIEKALLRFTGDARQGSAYALMTFGTASADALALRYLEGTDRDRYLATRAEQRAGTLNP